MSKRGEGPSSDMPPGKRPRLMAQPDGFSKPRPPKLAAPPKFASAFDGMETDRLDKRAAESASKAQKPQQKPFPTFSAFDSALKKPSSRPNGLPPAAQHARPMKSAPKPPVPLFNPAPPPSPPRARIRQPPPLPVPTPPPVEFSALRQMKLDPPPIPITPPKPSTTLKNLVPPRVPVVPATSIPPEKLRTINTTMLARTTDIFSESGPSELASLLLDYHAEVDEWATPHALEEKRGLIVSPEKANAKGKEKEKFVRGGLAAWARSFYDARESARSLWEKDTMRLISSLATRRVSSLLSLNPDMRLRVKHILHVPQLGFHQKPKADLSIPGIALCHIIAAPTVTDADPHEAPLPRSKDSVCAVLLSFASIAPARTGSATPRNPEDFMEGREVYVWRPWQTLTLPIEALQTALDEAAHRPAASVSADSRQDEDFFELFGPAVARAHHREKIVSTGLLCDRFVVVR